MNEENAVKIGERFVCYDAGMFGLEREAEQWAVRYRRPDGSEFERQELRFIP